MCMANRHTINALCAKELKIMIKKSKTPYVRDVYLAYLIKGARLTKTDEFPIIESWMISNEVPKEIVQWDRRNDVTNCSDTAMSFYCNDYTFTPILGNPKKYVEKLKKYKAVIGLDASPYDNMPLDVQKSQIFLNLAISYYYGMQGIKIIPNVRIGDNRTLSSLEAYPKNTLIAIGTNGFVRNLYNRQIYIEQTKKVIDVLMPTGILIYGPLIKEISFYAKEKNIPIYQFDSYTMKQNQLDKQKKVVINYEGK